MIGCASGGKDVPDAHPIIDFVCAAKIKRYVCPKRIKYDQHLVEQVLHI